MNRTIQCPQCGHLHPNGMGATICGCKDCHLQTMDYDILSEAAKARVNELWRMSRTKKGETP